MEHILSEGLGNSSLVLPNGVVCDRCNNGPLSKLDQSLCDFLPLKARAVMLGIAGKSGKVPTLKFVNGTMSNEDGNHINFHHTEPRAFEELSRTATGQVEFNLNVKGGRRLTARYAAELSSALLKIALELAWLDHGERMLGEEFDHVRDAVFGKARHGYFAIAKRGDGTEHGTTVSYFLPPDNPGRIAVIGSLLGHGVGTDSQRSSPVTPFDPDDALCIEFGPSDFKSKRVA